MGHRPAQRMIDIGRHCLRGPEIGVVQRQGEIAHFRQIERHPPLHNGSGRNSRRRRIIHGFAASVRCHRVAAQHHRALGLRVNLPVRPIERSQQQNPAFEAPRIARRRDRHIHLVAGRGKGRQRPGEENRRHVARLHHRGHRIALQTHAHPLQRRFQRLQRENRLRAVAGPMQAHHDPVSDQLIVPHPLHRRYVLDPRPLRFHRVLGVRRQQSGRHEQESSRPPGPPSPRSPAAPPTHPVLPLRKPTAFRESALRDFAGKWRR